MTLIAPGLLAVAAGRGGRNADSVPTEAVSDPDALGVFARGFGSIVALSPGACPFMSLPRKESLPQVSKPA